jgi:hypothetical protein
MLRGRRLFRQTFARAPIAPMEYQQMEPHGEADRADQEKQ